MDIPQLAFPSAAYQASFLEAMEELRQDDPAYENAIDLPVITDFESFLQQQEDLRNGVGLPEGFVPATNFWLVSGDRYIGRVSLRHQLNDNLLQMGGHIGYTIRPSERRKGYGTIALELALEEAKKLGLEKVLVTCDEDNVASRKIIERCKGAFENAVPQGDGKPPKRRYWIELIESA